jgi:hypothetical protein
MSNFERQSKRVDQLLAMGLKFDGDSFVYEDINFHHTDTLCMTDEEFDKAYAGAVSRKAYLDSTAKFSHSLNHCNDSTPCAECVNGSDCKLIKERNQS